MQPPRVPAGVSGQVGHQLGEEARGGVEAAPTAGVSHLHDNCAGGSYVRDGDAVPALAMGCCWPYQATRPLARAPAACVGASIHPITCTTAAMLMITLIAFERQASPHLLCGLELITRPFARQPSGSALNEKLHSQVACCRPRRMRRATRARRRSRAPPEGRPGPGSPSEAAPAVAQAPRTVLQRVHINGSFVSEASLRAAELAGLRDRPHR